MKIPHSDSEPFVSIVICLHVISDRFYTDLSRYDALDYKNYEILLVLNHHASVQVKGKKFRVITATQPSISLGEKRDLGVKHAKGNFVAFIDDDAYPRPDWLSHAVKVFAQDPKIGVVGGPNVTPPEDPFAAKIGGYIYESYLTSGAQQHRYIPDYQKDVLEVQGVNMIIRKELISRLGGFRHKLYSGDDSKICGEIRSLGYRVVYDPSVVVFHHRRRFPFEHLRQIRNMGTHRGFFVKAHPETLSPIYFLPALLTFGFLLGLIMMIFFPVIRIPFLLFCLFVFAVCTVSSLRRLGLIPSLIVALGIILTHMTYGIYFLYGFTKEGVERK